MKPEEVKATHFALALTTLRWGVAGCFIGHGAFGVITKAAWLPYFGVFHIGENWAWPLMPVVGSFDILVGLLVLVWPTRALLVWAFCWAVVTALLRPLSGEPIWEFFERAGNFGPPLALLFAFGRGPWFRGLSFVEPNVPPAAEAWMRRLLLVALSLLLLGHGGLGLLVQKPSLALHYSALGFGDGTACVPIVGALEMAAALVVFFVPKPALLVSIGIWKLATEALFLVAGAPFWEVVERCGSYAVPLALAFLVMRPRHMDSISGTESAYHA